MLLLAIATSDIFVNDNNNENDKEWPQFTITITKMIQICRTKTKL